MNRGDTLITTISIFNPDGTEYIPDPNNDTLRFALKKNYDDAEPLILKDIPVDTMVLRIDAEDTKILDQPDEYVYDIQLTYGDGIVDTILPNKKLRIVEEVD